MNKTLIYSKQTHFAYITLNRPQPDKKSISQPAGELRDICNDINHDRNVNVIILTGKGNQFYPGQAPAHGQPQDTLADAIAGITKPVIAAINGDALGRGLELALACDIRIAATTVHFGLPQITKGYIPSDGGTQRLPRLIGRGKALELILSGDIIDAEEALNIGLIHKILPETNLLPEVEKIAAKMAEKGPFALKYAKEAVLKGMDLTLEQGLRLEADLYMLLHTTLDRTEGVQAFQQKRPARFKGE